MSPAEIETIIIGSFASFGAVVAVAREAVKRNWIACSFSFRVTTPDGRYLKAPKVKQEPASEPVPEPAKDARILNVGKAS